MLWVLQYLVGKAIFYYPAVFHHDSSVGKHPDNRKVMRNDDHRDTKHILQFTDKVEHLCLDRNIKAGSDLVQKQQWRVVGNRF